MIRDRPVTSFLVITFGVSYVLGIPFNVAASSLLQPSGLAGIYVPRVVTVIRPAVAALLVVRASFPRRSSFGRSGSNVVTSGGSRPARSWRS